jgi:hypothetical protein
MALTVQIAWTKTDGRPIVRNTADTRSLRSVAEELDITYAWAHNLMQLAGISRQPGNGRAVKLTEAEVDRIKDELAKRSRVRGKNRHTASQAAPRRPPAGVAG